jgi:hypothetical protein
VQQSIWRGVILLVAAVIILLAVFWQHISSNIVFRSPLILRKNTNIQVTTQIPQTVEPFKEPSFEAQIIRKKQRYIRGKDVVSFRSRFKGHLTKGFFANQIFTPKVVDGTTIHVNYFDATTPNLSIDKTNVISYCPDTIEYWEAEGKLDGYVDISWKEWNWEIPEFAPLGEYKVRMMVWNNFPDNKKEPFRTIEDTFEVIDPDNSHYHRFSRINLGERTYPHDQ